MRTGAVILAVFLTAACAGKHEARSLGATPQATAPVRPLTMEMATIESPEQHKADVVLAVLPLRNHTGDKAWDSSVDSLDELLSAELATNRTVSVVERRRIEDVMNELKLGDSGVVDQNTAARIGGMLGANLMVIGSFAEIAGRYVVTMRLVKVETSEIVGGANQFLDSPKSMATAAQNLSTELIADLAKHSR